MARVHISTAGESLDRICFIEYGPLAGSVEATLEANQHIAAQAHRLPAGARITLPDLTSQTTAKGHLRLWD
jgi:phage tail protein X